MVHLGSRHRLQQAQRRGPRTGSDQDNPGDTPGGPITGNQVVPSSGRKPVRVVPCSWQATGAHNRLKDPVTGLADSSAARMDIDGPTVSFSILQLAATAFMAPSGRRFAIG